ncbi:MAG TPA: SPFH domain-containing protein [Candidatus Sulfopaludibacter sp.]|jgi:regulator of protease activity HflC (stomatin/prohibitin superfamily)|nr:SPFH domain-containing protein [Candidatus Sulfopaludibacter sp.]
MSLSNYTNFSISDDKITKKGSGIQLIFGVLLLIISIWIKLFTEMDIIIVYVLILFGTALIVSSFLIIINQYQRSIILRLGLYKKRVQPGIHTRIPLIDSVLVIDIRERVREFNAERMLTKDNVPVTIDAILRYKIMEERANDAMLNVENFNEMIKQVSQTTLRNNIGASLFQEILSKREEINHTIKSAIEKESANWGIMVTGVEIRQVIIPQELESAMSMQAQAEREKQARVTYGESEVLVAQKFLDASKVYASDPVAYALRQSNMLYETMKIHENTIFMVPSENLNSMGFGNLGASVAYLQNLKTILDSNTKRVTNNTS